MFRFNDIFLVIVACYVIYKIGFVDGFTLVNLFIAVCTVVAFVSTILRRSGYMERLKEKEKAEKLGVKAYRLSFTTETQQETEKIVRAFVDVYLRGQKPDGQMQTEETTKGHFQRGVE